MDARDGLTVFEFLRQNDIRAGESVADDEGNEWSVAHDGDGGLSLKNISFLKNINSTLARFVSIPGLKRVKKWWWVFFLEDDPAPRISEHQFATKEELEEYMRQKVMHAQRYKPER